MSKKIKERTKQLASREIELKKNLLGKSGGKSKANKAAKTAVAGGIIAVVLYFVYRSFSQEGKKPKKSKKTSPVSGVVTEKFLAFILPYLGELLTSFLNKPKESKNSKEEVEQKDED